uniref:Reverse transcriptase N-terminal domain-containing protein n=1 Tax=Campylaephora sungminbooi TaxID=1896769 RepID=A0A1B0TIC9_9FLOR|nr:hypothetical protein 13 [Campylaephora sungminbooi]
MISDCYIHRESDWKHLPWQHINGRVTLMQKKIFDASRQYNLKLLHKVQNFLLNSNEARLFAIDKMINSTNKYYKLYNCENYCSKDIDKFYLFKYLFNNNSILKVQLQFFLEQIKEYLIYLCIEPEWNARFNPANIHDIHSDYSQLISFKTYIDHINWSKIIYHTQYIPYISRNIYYWASNKFFVKDKNFIFRYLPTLLLKIYHLENQWHRIKLIKWSSFCRCLSKKCIKSKKQRFYFLFTLIIQNHLFKFYNCLSSIIIELKSKFYHKDALNRLRLNKQLNWINIIKITTLILQKKLCQKVKLLSHFYTIYIINAINFLLSSLKICQNYHHILNKLNHYQFNLFNMLYKKIIFNFLYKYLFKINR